MASKTGTPTITFLNQGDPPDEYGRALYAICRSLLRALLEQMGADDLDIIQTDRADVRLKQMAALARLDRDKGMRGDGFEWAVHEALIGGEHRVSDLVSIALRRASRYIQKDSRPTSLMFGYEKAKHLGFLDAVVDEAGNDARLLPDAVGRPYQFGPWVKIAAQGAISESALTDRIAKIWKTDLFLTDEVGQRYLAATVKSQVRDLEGGAGLRIGIVPEDPRWGAGVKYDKVKGLWVVSLPDPDGFMGLFNDAYALVAETIYKLGKHGQSKYWMKPSAKARRIQEQLEKMGEATVLEIENALNDASQPNLITVEDRLVPVQAPPWLHLPKVAPQILAPRPRFLAVD